MPSVRCGAQPPASSPPPLPPDRTVARVLKFGVKRRLASCSTALVRRTIFARGQLSRGYKPLICRAFISAAIRAALRAYSTNIRNVAVYGYKAAVVRDAVGDSGHAKFTHPVVNVVARWIFLQRNRTFQMVRLLGARSAEPPSNSGSIGP